MTNSLYAGTFTGIYNCGKVLKMHEDENVFMEHRMVGWFMGFYSGVNWVDDYNTDNTPDNDSIYYAMIKPEGNGSIKNLPFFKDPLISYNLTYNDKKMLAEAVKKLCELLLAAGAETIFPSIHNGPVIKNEGDLISLPEQINSSKTSIMTVHLFSSCPMGEDRNICVVDSYGKVHGQENLWVSDASMIPSAIGVNPQGTIMAFAKRNAEKIIADS